MIFKNSKVYLKYISVLVALLVLVSFQNCAKAIDEDILVGFLASSAEKDLIFKNGPEIISLNEVVLLKLNSQTQLSIVPQINNADKFTYEWTKQGDSQVLSNQLSIDFSNEDGSDLGADLFGFYDLKIKYLDKVFIETVELKEAPVLPPTVSLSMNNLDNNSEISLVEGASLQINANYSGYPDPTLSISADRGATSIITTASNGSVTASVTARASSVQSSDYVITVSLSATNDEGSRIASFKINVQRKIGTLKPLFYSGFKVSTHSITKPVLLGNLYTSNNTKQNPSFSGLQTLQSCNNILDKPQKLISATVYGASYKIYDGLTCVISNNVSCKSDTSQGSYFIGSLFNGLQTVRYNLFTAYECN